MKLTEKRKNTVVFSGDEATDSFGLADLIQISQQFYTYSPDGNPENGVQLPKDQVEEAISYLMNSLRLDESQKADTTHAYVYVKFYDLNTLSEHKLRIPVSNFDDYKRALEGYQFFMSNSTPKLAHANNWMSSWKILNRYRNLYEIK